MKNLIDRRDKLKKRNPLRKREVKARKHFPDFKAPSSEKLAKKISEIEAWIEKLKTLKVTEDTKLDGEETVLFLKSLEKELMITGASDEVLRILNSKISEVLCQKRKEIAELVRKARKKRKELNRQLDLKHFAGSAADKLLKMVSERKPENVELVKGLLDRIWRRSMNGGMLNGKDFEAIDAAKRFLRDVNSPPLKRQK